MVADKKQDLRLTITGICHRISQTSYAETEVAVAEIMGQFENENTRLKEINKKLLEALKPLLGAFDDDGNFKGYIHANRITEAREAIALAENQTGKE